MYYPQHSSSSIYRLTFCRLFQYCSYLPWFEYCINNISRDIFICGDLYQLHHNNKILTPATFCDIWCTLNIVPVVHCGSSLHRYKMWLLWLLGKCKRCTAKHGSRISILLISPHIFSKTTSAVLTYSQYKYGTTYSTHTISTYESSPTQLSLSFRVT